MSQPEINIKTNAATNPANKWLPIDEFTPRGVKLQLINKASGVAAYGKLPSTFYTHYYLLPEFDD